MSRMARGWRLLGGAALVMIIGIVAFTLVAAATVRPRSVPTATAGRVAAAWLRPRAVQGAIVAGTVAVNATTTLGLGTGVPDRRATAGTKSTTTTTGASGTTTTTTPGLQRLLAGTVTSVDGAVFHLTVEGKKVATVVTTAATQFTQTAKGAVADATAGTTVVAIGIRPGAGSVVATRLVVLPAAMGTAAMGTAARLAAPTAPGSTALLGIDGVADLVKLPLVVGTVTANRAGTLTIVGPFGTETVTTTASTSVTATTTTTATAVAAGVAIQVIGTAGADGSVTASVVHVGSLGVGLGAGTSGRR